MNEGLQRKGLTFAQQGKSVTFPWHKLLVIPVAFVAYGLQRLAGLFPEQLESGYARTFYPVVVGAWSRLTGLLPFSLMEVLLGLLILSVPILFVLQCRKTAKAAKGVRLRTFFRPLPAILAFLSIWYALTVPMWNLNYARPSFAELSGLTPKPANAATLKSVCLKLAEEANSAREEVSEDGKGRMVLTGGVRSVLDRASSGYDVLSGRFRFLSGKYGRPKPVLLSPLMSWTRIIGIYTVTTAEANVDVAITPVEIPFTVLHEMAHQRGIAREDEANASAWFACRVHPDADFRYSGALQAWIYASNALRAADASEWNDVAAALSPAVKRDLAAQSAYWSRYDSVVDKVAEKANDTWLKTNGQTDGVKSYGRMVDLIIAEYAGA